MNDNLSDTQYVLMRKLCVSFMKGKQGDVENIYVKAVESYEGFTEAEFQTSFSPIEEDQIIDQIKKYFISQYTNSDEVYSRFRSIYSSFRNNPGTTKCNTELLLCLLRIGENNLAARQQEYKSQAIKNVDDLISTIDHSVGIENTASSSHESSIMATNIDNSPIHDLHKKFTSQEAFSPSVIMNTGLTEHLYSNTPLTQDPIATSSMKGSITKTKKSIGDNVYTSSADSSGSSRNRLPLNLQFSDKKSNDFLKDFEVTEYEIIKELIFCMQGIEGRVIKYMSVKEGFHLSPCVKVHQESIVRYLMELGYLHNLIQHYLGSFFTDVGIVAQGLTNAIRRELTEYYQTLADLDSQLICPPEVADTPLSEEQYMKYNIPTLSQLFVWSRKPLEKLKTLCDVLRLVQDKRGGEIITVLAFLSCNGNVRVREIILRLLAAAIQPFYKQIFYWVVNGEIIDTNEEFFIKVANQMDNPDMILSWDEKYSLRTSMIPQYMSQNEAKQILETGRGMNFLHNVCLQRPPMTPAQKTILDLDKNKWTDAESLIKPCNHVSEIINNAYIEVSKIVLQTLCNKFKIKVHFEALRKYMLLGQGDFVHHLLEIMEPDLNKPVENLQVRNIVQFVDEAIEKSNAQYDDPEVLKKIGVETKLTNRREQLQDVFYLQYKLDGPLNEIFKNSLISYNRIFAFMWRVKRAHHMVLKIWRGLKLLHKSVNKIVPETRSTFIVVNALVMEMMNFLNHYGYYIAFEVVELKWREFQADMSKLESLDKVLISHNAFLNAIQKSCQMISPVDGSMTMECYARSMQESVHELVPIVETFQTLCECELERRKMRQHSIAISGTSSNSVQKDILDTQVFIDEISKIRIKFSLIAQNSRATLKKLLEKLSEYHDDNDLVLLKSRIDFNGYYKGLVIKDDTISLSSKAAFR